MSQRPTSEPEMEVIDLNAPEFQDYRGPASWMQPGWTITNLLTASSLRGLVAIVVALLVLGMRNPTPKLIQVLIAAVLIGWSLGGLAEMLRGGSRTALSISRIIVLLVLAGGLILWPAFTLDQLGRLIGSALIAGGLVNGIRAGSRRNEGHTVEPIVGAVLYVALGIALVVSPQTILGLALLILTFYWFVAGVMAVLTNLASPRSDQVSPSDTWRQFLSWVQARPETADDRLSLYARIFYEGTEARRRLSRFFVLMGFATAIASWGIIADSTAVVIGAMLVAPLMTPLMGTSLAMAMGWPRRARMTALVALGGILFSIGLSVVFGWVYGLGISSEVNSQVASRIAPTLVDLAIAVAAGGAGAFALSRTDVSDSLPGVAVAIALVPPLSVVGLMSSQGDWAAAAGALLLFLTNLVAILLVGAVVFVLTGVVPVLQLARNSQWVKGGLGMVGALALGVVAVLGTSSEHFENEITGLRQANAVVDEWMAGTGLTRTSARLAGETLRIVVQGPEAPPPIEDLGTALEEEFGHPFVVTVRWVPQTEFVYPPPDEEHA